MKQQKTTTGGKDYIYLLPEDIWSEFMRKMWPEQFLGEQIIYFYFVLIY